jgi:hypothetical protein
MRRAILASLLFALPALAAPAPKDPAPKTPRPIDTAPHKEGDYGGVDPGKSPSSSDRPKFQHPPPKGTLSWIGFEAKDGGATVFFQSPGPFDVSQVVDGGSLYVYLTGLNRLGANEWRAIDTRFFDNPLARLEARIVGKAGASKAGPAHPAGAQVKITFKNAKDAHEGTLKAAQEADGYYYAYLTFGAGTGDKEPDVKEPEK